MYIMSVITWMLSISIQDWERSWRMGHFLLKNAKTQYVGRFVSAWGEISRKYFSLDKENENVSKIQIDVCSANYQFEEIWNIVLRQKTLET